MKFIAHRGYSKAFPENSLDAFDAVVRHPRCGLNLIGIELDIHLTADGKIAVLHDIEVDDERGESVWVCDISLSRLRQLRRTDKNGRPFTVPDINETLSVVSHRCELCFELKQGGYDADRFCMRLVQALERYRPSNDVVLSSFSVDLLARAMAVTAHLGVRYAFIADTWKAYEDLPDGFAAKLSYFNPWYGLVFENLDVVRRMKIPVQCWTVNTPAAVQSLLNLPLWGQIRAVMTDDISLCEQFRDE
jgi:glycerophosphoryl diester phosphodiesterase